MINIPSPAGRVREGVNMISIVFFGTPDIGLKSLEHFYNSDKFEVLA